MREENVLGVLTAVVRGGRTVPVTSPAYRLYVRLWCAPWRLRIALLRLRGLAARVWRRLRR